ncbi:MAG TPA: hypothetical protein PLD25_32530 [Chloroflexota bacterium]|nr:hypothetical protein [Chloroflexota bacterium]HUM68464.1 hypothetical protein [Chloroflexota bacterium]
MSIETKETIDLNQQRLTAVLQALKASSAQAILDVEQKKRPRPDTGHGPFA